MTNSNVPLEDVLDDLVLQEPTPSYEALLRWIKRYPQHREALEQFFATWGVQSVLPQRTMVDEDKLVQKGVEHAMKIMRRQGRIIDRPPIESLLPMEQLVLAAVYLLHGEGYAAKIADKVDQMGEGRVMLATVFVALDRLEEAGLISAVSADLEEEPGKTIRHFKITFSGERALATAKERVPVLKGLLGDLA